MVCIRGQRNDHLRVRRDHESRAASGEDVLSAAAKISKFLHEVLLDPGRVKRVLRLVNDQWFVAVCEDEDEDRRALLPVGEALDGDVLRVLARPKLDGQAVVQIQRLEGQEVLDRYLVDDVLEERLDVFAIDFGGGANAVDVSGEEGSDQLDRGGLPAQLLQDVRAQT